MMATIFVLSVDIGLKEMNEDEALINRAETLGVTLIIVTAMRAIQPLMTLFNYRSKSASNQLRSAFFAGILILLAIAF